MKQTKAFDLLTLDNPFARAGARAALKLAPARRALHDGPAGAVPLLFNSIPKSGTHLLFPVLDLLGSFHHHGRFISSMRGSIQYTERSVRSTVRALESIQPGELCRSHLFFDDAFVEVVAARRIPVVFLCRDPVDVLVSEARYLRKLNRYHRLSPAFSQCSSLDEALRLSIAGGRVSTRFGAIDLEPFARRFTRYAGWVGSHDAVHTVRFESVASGDGAAVEGMVAHLRTWGVEVPPSFDAAVATRAALGTAQSHTRRPAGMEEDDRLPTALLDGMVAELPPVAKQLLKEQR